MSRTIFGWLKCSFQVCARRMHTREFVNVAHRWCSLAGCHCMLRLLHLPPSAKSINIAPAWSWIDRSEDVRSSANCVKKPRKRENMQQISSFHIIILNVLCAFLVFLFLTLQDVRALFFLLFSQTVRTVCCLSDYLIVLVGNLKNIFGLGWQVNTIKWKAECNQQHSGHQGHYQLAQAQKTSRNWRLNWNISLKIETLWYPRSHTHLHTEPCLCLSS